MDGDEGATGCGWFRKAFLVMGDIGEVGDAGCDETMYLILAEVDAEVSIRIGAALVTVLDGLVSGGGDCSRVSVLLGDIMRESAVVLVDADDEEAVAAVLRASEAVTSGFLLDDDAVGDTGDAMMLLMVVVLATAAITGLIAFVLLLLALMLLLLLPPPFIGVLAVSGDDVLLSSLFAGDAYADVLEAVEDIHDLLVENVESECVDRSTWNDRE